MNANVIPICNIPFTAIDWVNRNEIVGQFQVAVGILENWPARALFVGIHAAFLMCTLVHFQHIYTYILYICVSHLAVYITDSAMESHTE